MEKVTADSPIILTVQQHPEIIEIFMQYGLGCVGCMAANFETIGQGAAAHGLDVDALIADIKTYAETISDVTFSFETREEKPAPTVTRDFRKFFKMPRTAFICLTLSCPAVPATTLTPGPPRSGGDDLCPEPRWYQS